MIEEMMRNRDMQISSTDLEEVQRMEGLIMEDLEQLKLSVNREPWHNPSVLREVRRHLNAVTDKVSELQKLRSGQQAFQPSPSRFTASMAADKLATANSKPMTVEDALAMLLEKKGPKWQGGLIGIVHAAGVQEMTPITAHAPGRFEFVFAPKSQAAWNLHTFATMM